MGEPIDVVLTARMPELSEGWSWRLTRPVVISTDHKGNQLSHDKVLIELMLHDEVRRHAHIDVQMYGDGSAVVERARAMLRSVIVEQMQALGPL